MVFEKLKEIIADQLTVDAETITLESNITEDLGADSLDVVDLISSIEDEFDISIPEEAAENIKTVGDIASYLEKNVEAE
ncbi:MAG: acyl carrier protein [Oscillospiraceae bacterium]|nr:acyl carrier protein [Oscillospiraceae bacterium]